MNAQRLSNTLLSGLVTRYHAVPSVRPQTTGQHQWGVAVLMIYLTQGQCSRAALIEALLHDTAELFTGDVPFTVKRDNPGVKAIFDEMERRHREKDLLPEKELPETSKQLLKLCDTLEGLIWCALYEQRGGPVGDRWAQAYNKCQSKFALLADAYPGIWEKADQLADQHLSLHPPVPNSTTQ